MLSVIVIVVLSYLVGSIPTSIIASRIARGQDIRRHGSGNAGATNVFRVMGWKAGVAVAIVDIAKGAFAALVISMIRIGGEHIPVNEEFTIQLMAGASAVLGHIWTIFADFKGGKGVATTIGMLIGTFPGGLIFGIPVFIGAVLITGYVSLSSILATAAIPMSLIFVDETGIWEVPAATIWFTIGVALLIIYTHRSNIQRLLTGNENRFGKKKAT